MDYMRIIAMPLLKCLSELFEKMKNIVKSKDLTPGDKFALTCLEEPSNE